MLFSALRKSQRMNARRWRALASARFGSDTPAAIAATTASWASMMAFSARVRSSNVLSWISRTLALSSDSDSR